MKYLKCRACAAECRMMKYYIKNVAKNLIIAWNWVSWYRAACRRGLRGTVNSFTQKITPQTELPNSPSTPQCMQLSPCLIYLNSGVSIQLCLLSTVLWDQSVSLHCILQRSNQYFLILTVPPLQLQRIKTISNVPFPFSIFIQGVSCLGLLIHVSIFSLS